ncbi:MAG: hypothetical protein L0312_27045, partial [Acidobacteria bacterium]|nr:hypothetical protein [Acidobacteriota bacterium]
MSGPLTEEIWEAARRAATDAPNLPRSALDEWGLSSETQLNASSGESTRVSRSVASIASLLAQRPLSRALQDYFSAVGNFFGQAKLISATHGFIGRQPIRRDEIQAVADRAGYNDANVRLSKFNLFSAMQRICEMQEAYDERVGLLVDSTKLAQVKRRETQLFPELWALWYQFCHHPEKRYVNAPTQSLAELERAREDLQQALVNGLAQGTEWRGRLLRSDYSWETKRSLVLELAVDTLQVLEEAKEALYGTLETIFGNQATGGLTAYALDLYWQYVLVIPTMGGRVLGGTWALPESSFSVSSEERLFDRGWLKILHPLSSE